MGSGAGQRDIDVMDPVVTAKNGRTFSCFPAAILVIVVNARGEVLLFSKSSGAWEVIAGGMESGENVLEAALRELGEEAGANLSVQPVGVVHAHTFAYDEAVPNMISICYAMRYLGGDIRVGDDMQGATYAWRNLASIGASELRIPKAQKWILERAVGLVASEGNSDVPLQ